LLARVDAMRQAEAAPRPASEDVTSFRSVPAYDEVRMQLRIAERFGIDVPYFRVHDGLNGAHARIGDRDFLNFCSYDYLGLNGHPEVIEAAKAALDRYGVSASASRVVAGARPVHVALERALAEHYGCEDALTLVSGYATNLSVIGHLMGPKDLVIYDAAMHHSAVMGGLLAGSARRSFLHNDLDNLESILAGTRHHHEHALIVVEGLYSMDGDCPDLARLIEIKQRYKAWLMVDDAHAIGVLGPRGYGSFEQAGIDPRKVDIWMGTLSKTLSSCGGYIAGSAEMVDCVKRIVGAFVYSVAMPPVIAAASLRALEIMHREPERVARLQRNGRMFFELARKHGLNAGSGFGSAICPIIVGDSLPAGILSQRLFERGINVMPVVHPAVPAKESRLRFFLTASHTEADLATAIAVTAEELGRIEQTVQKHGLPGYGS
jgi:8-amino-7-oxononanoate synthase